MKDFVTKARENRLRALSAHVNGVAMFFPDDEAIRGDVDDAVALRNTARHARPLFVRSQPTCSSADVETPQADLGAFHVDTVAVRDTIELTGEFAISNVMRMVA
jgi:hypothetical protein